MTAAAQSDAAGFPVRQGERRWTAAEITKVRNQLAGEAAELREEIEKAESDIADRLGDSITNAVVVATLSARGPVRLLGGLLKLRVTRNPGAAFSIGPSLTVVFAVIAV